MADVYWWAGYRCRHHGRHRYDRGCLRCRSDGEFRFPPGMQNAFVAKLNGSSGTLLYSSYLGGSGATSAMPETALDIAVDYRGCAYVVGFTNSRDFPVIAAFQPSSRAIGSAAFVTEVAADGRSLVFSTYLAGVGSQEATAVRVNPDGSIVVSGWTTAADFPGLPASASNGLMDAFVAVLARPGVPVRWAAVALISSSRDLARRRRSAVSTARWIIISPALPARLG